MGLNLSTMMSNSVSLPAISQADLPTFRELEHSIWAVRNSAVAAPPRAQPGYYSSSPNTTPAPSGPHTMTNFNNYQQSYNIPYPVGSGSGQRGLPMASQGMAHFAALDLLDAC